MEKFCLKWNDYQSNIGHAFNDLREEKDFFDVTLACEDNQIEAHKVVLSACSPFFKSILKRNPHQHPLLYLKGVNSQDLGSLLNFMYQGQVNVAQENLNTFLTVAEELKVKGLTQGSSEKAKKKTEPESNNRAGQHKPQNSQMSTVKSSESVPKPFVSIPQLVSLDDDVKCIDVPPSQSSSNNAVDAHEADDQVIDVVNNDPCYEDEQYLESDVLPADHQDVTNQIHSRLQRIASETGPKSRGKKEFSPKVTGVMSLDQQFNKNSTKMSLDQKLQCLLCYKRFATKEESAVHMKTRHRITLAGAIDKSMRSVFN